MWRWLTAPAALVVGFAAYFALVPRSVSFGMFEEGAGAGTARLLIAFAATILGVLIGSAYRLLSKQKGLLPPLRLWTRDLLRSTDLWLGLVVAPIVYALLINTTDGMDISGLVVIALQNGFCAQAIIQGLIARQEREHAPPEAASSP